ncbi:hypothetical protein BGZ63DRAFT_218539 [Mariannaea sp. PMI_226]|nr:hypothetical protein BGZ63DRAFT_218539 [Mariannaea sp. PMI_226]
MSNPRSSLSLSLLISIFTFIFVEFPSLSKRRWASFVGPLTSPGKSANHHGFVDPFTICTSGLIHISGRDSAAPFLGGVSDTCKTRVSEFLTLLRTEACKSSVRSREDHYLKNWLMLSESIMGIGQQSHGFLVVSQDGKSPSHANSRESV